MFRDGTLFSPYDFEAPNPPEDTAIQFIINRAAFICNEGYGKRRWLTETETEEYITFDQVEPFSRNIASALYKRGMRHGDTLLYSSHDGARVHIFMIGAWRANGVMRAAYPEDSVDTLVERILESNVKWFLCDPGSVAEVLSATGRIPWKVEVICFGKAPAGCSSAYDLLDDDGSECPKLDVQGDEMALILATSGTTGASKGAVYTQKGLAKVFSTYQTSFIPSHTVQGEDLLMMGRPTHITGSCIPFAALAGGQGLLMITDVTKESIFHAVQKYKPAGVFGFPKYLLYLANDPDASKYDLSSIKVISSGGVVLTPSFIKTMESKPGVRVVNGYGMTECGLFCTTRNCDPYAESKLWNNVPDFSVGKLSPGTILQVRDVETGFPLGPNQEGELCFKNELVCSGYLNKPEENQKTFPDGWVKTGDIGYFDDNGFVFVVDRIKEIFKYYNNHISPSELENVILRHPAVDNACVVGVPDPEGGDSIPRAFVTLKDSVAVAADEIRKFANDNLATYKKLRGGLIILPELPVGKTGKVERRVLSKVQISVPREIATF